jgi:hypothetical protein
MITPAAERDLSMAQEAYAGAAERHAACQRPGGVRRFVKAASLLWPERKRGSAILLAPETRLSGLVAAVRKVQT